MMIATLWVVLALAAAAVLGWPLTLLVLRLARVVDPPRPALPPADPAADQVLDLRIGPPGGPGLQVHAEAPAGGPEPQAAAPAPGPGAPAAPPETVLRGGLLIGMLERLAVATAILASEPVAIAYVVAIKGLGRYAELKETPAAAERFIIGTLTSMLWAVGVAVAVRIFVLDPIT